MKKIAFIVEKTATGFSAYAKDFEKNPIGTTGKDITTLKQNIVSALNLYCDHKGLKTVSDSDIILALN